MHVKFSVLHLRIYVSLCDGLIDAAQPDECTTVKYAATASSARIVGSDLGTCRPLPSMSAGRPLMSTGIASSQPSVC